MSCPGFCDKRLGGDRRMTREYVAEESAAVADAVPLLAAALR